MNNRVLITGSGGFVGKNLYKMLSENFEVFGIDKKCGECVDKQVEIDDESMLESVMNSFDPDQVVHLAALSNVEKCEIEKELAYKQNVLPAKKMVEWSKKNGRRIIFASSDYVYDGFKGNFTEDDDENPLQYYGQNKLECEKIISELSRYVILRPTVIYGWDLEGMNFFMQMYRNQINKKSMKVPVDQINNPTYVGDFCRLIKNVLSSDTFGKFVATGNESMSRYDFALKICNYFGWDKKLIIPVETKSLDQLAKRPLNNSTQNNLVKKIFDFKFNSLEDNLGLVMQYIDKEYV